MGIKADYQAAFTPTCWRLYCRSARLRGGSLSGFVGGAPSKEQKKRNPGTLDLFITCADKSDAHGSHFLVLIVLIKSRPCHRKHPSGVDRSASPAQG